MFGVISKEGVSLKRDTVCPVGWERSAPLPTFVLLTPLHGLCHHSYAWGSDPWMTPGIRSPCSDLWTSWLTHLGWPHCDSACSDSGLRVPCLCRFVLSSMARFLQHACLLASFPVGLYSDRAPGSALDRLRETYQLRLHCFRDTLFNYVLHRNCLKSTAL